MRTTIIRSIVLLLLLTLGLTLAGYGFAMRSVTSQFLTAENTFRENPIKTSVKWVDSEPSTVTRKAQDSLGVNSLMEIRNALVMYRKAQVNPAVSDYFYRPNTGVDRELAKVKLSQITQSSKDVRIIIQVATLLGDLYAQDAVRYAESGDKEKSREAYDRAVEAFTFAINADATDTLNKSPKEDLEALIRFFMGGSSGGEQETPANGPRGGASDPGEGY